MRGLRNWYRQLVRRPRSSEERLRVALAELPAHPHYLSFDPPLSRREADDVLRLLHRHREAAASGSRPGSTGSVGLGPFAGPVSGESDAGPYWGSYTVTYDSTAGYGD